MKALRSWVGGILAFMLLILGPVNGATASLTTLGSSDGAGVVAPLDLKSSACNGKNSRAIKGTENDDVLIGTPGDDVLMGLGGNDTIIGLGGNDVICGGPGNDTLEGDEGNDTLEGDEGNDRLSGNAGDDTLYGGVGDDTLLGNAGDDTLYGGVGDDTLLGNAGDDTLYGGVGDDLLCGGFGHDKVNGGAGHNYVVDAGHNDALILVTSVSLTEQLRRLAKKSKVAIITYTMYNNWQTKRRYQAGAIDTSSGALLARMTLAENVTYIQRVFADYLRYAEISIDALREKRILKIGTGDNFGVALKLLAAGARQVVCVDRFLPKRDVQQQQRLYQAVRESLSEGERGAFDTVITLNGGVELNAQKLLPLYGVAIEEAEKRLEPESFDLIMSRSVMEHVYDPDQAFSVMDRLLTPGGRMIHKIDFRDHGMFSDNGFHPLTFLTIPEPVYRLMTVHSGRPNRRLLPYYRHKMAALGYDARLLITHVVGSEADIVPHKEHLVRGVDYFDSTIALLDKIRPKLQAQFRGMSDEELMVSGIFLVAQKPRATADLRTPTPGTPVSPNSSSAEMADRSPTLRRSSENPTV